MSEKTATQTTKRTSSRGDGISADEKAAMRELARESRRGARSKTDGESDVLEAIAKMTEPDRGMAQRLHDLIKASAPDLAPRTWYGMPAYAKDGDVICFFQNAGKFKARYSTLGFNDKAKLDEGEMWATSFALKKLTSAEEKRIVELIKRAVGTK